MTGFLLDTNIPSEFSRAQPEPRVVQWLEARAAESLFLSAVTIGEIRRGLAMLPDGQRRTRLEAWFHGDLVIWFQDRILPVTRPIAERWGVLDARSQLRGRQLNTADGMIAATALEHGLTLVTRNTKDFQGLNVELFNPWNS